MRHRHAPLVPLLVALAVLALAPPAFADAAFTVSAQLTSLGNVGTDGQARYRFDYTIHNVAVDPDLGAFLVFFNSDPSTQLPSGDHATFVSYAAPAGWEDVTVMPKNAAGQWSVTWDWDYATLPEVVPGSSLGGFSVVFDWNDPASAPAAQHAEGLNGMAHDAVTELASAAIAGTVTGTCGTTAPLAGITVDLFAMDANGQEVMVASTATDGAGYYSFAGLALGTYDVVIVTPLGYVADEGSKLVAADATGVDFTVDFGLTCEEIIAQPRTIGYWKHQVNCHLTGKGHAQESLGAMAGYVDLILLHFNQHITNPVIIYVPPSFLLGDELLKLDQLLTVNRNGTMLDRAKQQLLALLLNVVSGKIAQTQVIGVGGVTVSQAITHCNDLIQDGLASNDETAKTIADLINNGQPVPGGLVPISTRIITYDLRPGRTAAEFALEPPSPNPARAVVTIAFALTRAEQVDLRVHDVSGRTVRRLAGGAYAAGAHRLAWDGTDDAGARVHPGVYFCRLVTDEGTRTRPVTFQR
jgi:hypothetical protein